MFLLWGTDLAVALTDDGLRETLRSAGGTRLQVNVDDDAVSGAMRIPTGEPIAAVVSLWDADPMVAAAALEAVAARVAGWTVEERLPIEPPEQADGVRLEGLANLAVLRRPSELTPEEWLHRWRVDHTPIAIETQATFGYVQNLVLDAVTPDAPYVSGIVEELFPSAGMHDMHAFYGSDGDDAELERRITRLMASVSRIGADRDLDLVPTSRYVWDLRA